jgi:hypothetical protein
MKDKALWFLGVLLAFSMINCGIPQLEGEKDAGSTADAGKRFADVYDAVMQEHATGDTSGIVEYLSYEDGDGVVGEVFQESGLDPFAQESKFFWWRKPRVGLPAFDSGEFEDGDVLFSRNTKSFVSNFIAWLYYQGTFTHCGVFDADAVFLGNEPAVISATLELGVSGVTYETWDDWNENTTVALKRYEEDLDDDALDDAQNGVISQYAGSGSTYSFVYCDPALGLVPVSARATADDFAWPLNHYKGTVYYANPWLQVAIDGFHAAFAGADGLYDDFRWYCSKTTYWIYKLMGYDIEDNNYADARWGDVESSGWYILYKALLDVQGIPYSDIVAKAFTYYSSKLIAIPDEIYYAGCWDYSAEWPD